ncbi:B-box zinc finger protein [Thalictrum thalictroides]|uniref:B-box zinc finger protein n=1 Tax=Thalictrum thalictroides TaxID=46969 RepID=A0A7J6VZJ6_THATH|nr:B-box zinc finger protein [Thalictrum thalictroides]
MKERFCELCNGEATLYCVSDLAFLCLNCDARVHQANFLVARHVRRTICCKCKDFDGNSISGVGSRRHIEPICPSCLSEVVDSDHNNNNSSCTSSSTCISSANHSSDQRNSSKIVFSTDEALFLPINFSGEVSTKKKKKNRKIAETRSLNMDFKEEDILVNWYRKLGVKCNKSYITLALQAFAICLQKTTNLPFRVSLASSLWLSLKLTMEIPAVATCQNLKKLEKISGVPAKLILLAEKKISIALKKNEGALKKYEGGKLSKLDQMQEGWAECSDD